MCSVNRIMRRETYELHKISWRDRIEAIERMRIYCDNVTKFL